MRRFEIALRCPERAQYAHLRSILKAAAGTAWADQCGIHATSSLDDFREQVPIQSPAGLEPWIQRILRGEENVLTREPITRLVPTSGTTGAHKLIPMTGNSRREFSASVNLWLGNTMRQQPEIMKGRCYIATSPAADFRFPKSVLPVGFADDSAYLGKVERAVVGEILAVPPEVSLLRGSAWKDATRDLLLKAHDLRFLSLWHPSYLNALFDEGELNSLAKNWPHLTMVSTWSDGACLAPAQKLMSQLPRAIHQRKGLWLTEGAVSIPWQGSCPVAVLSGFFEFEHSDGTIHLAHELEVGVSYRPILTNHAGIYRYRLGDLVQVEGFVDRTPSLRWLGRADKVSDLCGEKLSDAQVAAALEAVGWKHFAALLPVSKNGRNHYLCIIPDDTKESFPLGEFEECLKENPHYSWALDVGQLGSLKLCLIKEDQISLLTFPPDNEGGNHQKSTHILTETSLPIVSTR